MSTAAEVFAAASALSTSDKWTLLTQLWASIPVDAGGAPDAAELAEVQRRSAEFDAGGIVPVTRDEVRRQIRICLNGDG